MRVFLVALPSEVNIRKLKIFWEETVNGQTIYHLEDDLLVFTGVGKTNAAMVTTFVLTKYPQITGVINFGSCGSLHQIEPLTIVKATAFRYVDVDVTGFGYAYGQIPHENLFFHFSEAWDAVVGTADSFINRANYLRFADLDAVDVIDMEGAAIAQVCAHFGKTLTAYKVVSDTIFAPEIGETAWSERITAISQILTEFITKELDHGRKIHPEF